MTGCTLATQAYMHMDGYGLHASVNMTTKGPKSMDGLPVQAPLTMASCLSLGGLLP
jgi:hypothetical protein